MPNYQQGQSYFKHFVEIYDDKGHPIKVSEKFRENHPKSDVSFRDVLRIRNIIFNKSLPKEQNNYKISLFRKRKNHEINHSWQCRKNSSAGVSNILLTY